ncbi:MAG: hypothetical protein JNL58_24095 [Planctomyces sp.]|nr:hypothetical protein [Planctomyces sp.]
MNSSDDHFHDDIHGNRPASVVFQRVYSELLTRMPLGETELDKVKISLSVLLHEVWLNLRFESDFRQSSGRRLFFLAAGEAMQRILTSCARRHGCRILNCSGEILIGAGSRLKKAEECVDLLVIDEAISSLELRDPEKAVVLRLRFFAGLELLEIAAVLSVSLRTVTRQWNETRNWLAEDASISLLE